MKIVINRDHWLQIGKTAGWIKEAKSDKDIIKNLKSVADKIGISDGYGDVWFNTKTKTVSYVAGDWWDKECELYDTEFGAVPGVRNVEHEAEVGKDYYKNKDSVKIWP